MTTEEQIENYIASQPASKRAELVQLHERVQQIAPDSRLWFLDGKNAAGKVVSNPSIGYGQRMIDYADGSTKEFYQIGLSANTTGLSVYILGIEDRKLLAEKFGNDLGKASVTGYCIKFRSLKDIDVGVLEDAIRFGFAAQKGQAS